MVPMNVLKSIEADHGHILKVVDCLRKEAQRLTAGEKANFSLLLDALQYLSDYGDQYHHAKEDLVYAHFLAKTGEAREIIEMLVGEHEVLQEKTRWLCQETDAIMHDAIEPLEPYIQALASFCALQTEHLETEESDVLPLLASRLTPQDWQAIETQMPGRGDPLFSKGPSSKDYEILFRHIAGKD